MRALESAASADGTLRAGEGMAHGRLGRGAKLRVADAILTGVHQPGESHYELLRAFAGDALLERVSAAANARGYRAHEFGDSLLIERGRCMSRAGGRPARGCSIGCSARPWRWDASCASS